MIGTDHLQTLAVVRTPGEAAELAAEALRAVNRLTLGPPSTGAPGWEDVSDLYRVIGELHVLAERLPQALGQLARHLEHPAGDCRYRSDSSTCDPPEALVATAAGALAVAQDVAADLASDLGAAQSAVAHLSG